MFKLTKISIATLWKLHISASEIITLAFALEGMCLDHKLMAVSSSLKYVKKCRGSSTEPWVNLCFIIPCISGFYNLNFLALFVLVASYYCQPIPWIWYKTSFKGSISSLTQML